MYNTVIRVHEATRGHREKPLSTFKNQISSMFQTNFRGPSKTHLWNYAMSDYCFIYSCS